MLHDDFNDEVDCFSLCRVSKQWSRIGQSHYLAWWYHHHLPSRGHGFKSQAEHLHFFPLYNFKYICLLDTNVKRTKINKNRQYWPILTNSGREQGISHSSVVSSALTILRPRVQMTSFNQIKYFVSAFVYLLDIGSGETNEPTV